LLQRRKAWRGYVTRAQSLLLATWPGQSTVLAGVAIGAVAVEGLHAQAKPKAYTVTETETIDATAQAELAKAATAAQQPAGGHALRTGGGKIVQIDGAPPPKRVILTEWDSLEQALFTAANKANAAAAYLPS
jgi:uncharacterized protein (DUF1330 family)